MLFRLKMLHLETAISPLRYVVHSWICSLRRTCGSWVLQPELWRSQVSCKGRRSANSVEKPLLSLHESPQPQVRPGNPAVPGLGGLWLSHDRWFLLPVVSVHAALRRQRNVSTDIQKEEMARQRSVNSFPLLHTRSYASSCLMYNPGGITASKPSVILEKFQLH